ncbi:MAG: alpha-ketoacid dehydrogenase subunit beta [Pontimonas sp.]|mgnify:FL=1|jgi:2-oxoisovalerate dehydrogenase E1 component beta subunit|nr:alpha-ketoacid dehydrogenase subunit beta [Pontimonas sp.]MDA8863329.1 alpha-ketoacid dehydrogenase subunit beta [Pontimonas sp.]MDP4633553.1 alpha-ketoacid dehydrogenase subunit beta [Pontimonas sp.]MDP4816109.1 alpha-ketoacid dehydrogenase subunit beta [Pontimonas sp.]MDP4900096.1 alpha-ketoacid dehydrogenase subunit beta [Pontimonas sp.]MDP4972266.1 alpha-ketoacid dehydrogenase subunit beta [Pontimonas sp.]
MTDFPLAKAITEGLKAAMSQDPSVMLMGEDIAQLGGVFRVTEGLQEEFGPNRVIDTPLAESGIVGTAIGLAMRGYRPVCEIQFDGFLYPAFDQIVTQLAKLTARHEGTQSFPVVIRIPYGGHIGAVEHHQESPEAYFAHTAGLRVVAPATPHDAYWLIQDAIASNDPVIYLEPKSRYWHKGPIDTTASGAQMGQARVVRQGSDLTLIGHGAMVSVMHQAAEIAQSEGVSLELIDLRSLSPIDYDTILDSVRRTGRAIVAQEAPGNASVGSEIAATLTEKAFYVMEAPVLRVSGFNTPFPPARLESLYLPDADRILDAVDRSLAY